MEFRCPGCDQAPVTLSDRECPRCHQSLSVGSVWRLYWKRTRERLREVTAMQCPACRQPNPISARTCAGCGEAITARRVLDTTLQPVRRPVRSFFLNPPWSVRWLVQLAYLGFSGWALYRMVLRIATMPLGVMVAGALYSIVFVPVLLFLAPHVLPHTMLSAIARRASGATRLGLALNGLTLVLYSMEKLGILWTVPLVPAVALLVIYQATKTLNRVIWPEFIKVREIFQDPGGSHVDPTKPQGRKAHRN